MPDDLRPPPESAHFRWHWIETPAGLEPWMWDERIWIQPGTSHPLLPTRAIGCRYSHPCDPGALIINPEDARQVERVARELCFQRISYTKGSKDRFVWSRWIDENWIYLKTAAQATLSDLKALADE